MSAASVGPPAIVLFIRGALPGWAVSWEAGEPVAAHPEGASVRWTTPPASAWAPGPPAWTLTASDAVWRQHWAELRSLELVRAARHQGRHVPRDGWDGWAWVTADETSPTEGRTTCTPT
jgi:hypothetical protein